MSGAALVALLRAMDLVIGAIAGFFTTMISNDRAKVLY